MNQPKREGKVLVAGNSQGLHSREDVVWVTRTNGRTGYLGVKLIRTHLTLKP